ncbi:DNA polymerase I [Candidatus Dependentiae bacterium]|nr:MAG: DNA polymerase I [Candidatus Dependentiae bacterium]
MTKHLKLLFERPMQKFDPKKTAFLIDGSSFLYRAYYGLRPLHTSKGVPVQAVYSFCRMIRRLIDLFSPAYIALVWDSKGKTKRHEIYTEYKATRQEPPSDLFDQKELILEFANRIGLKNVSMSGIEADDIMFSLVKELKKESLTTILITSDKDMGQALNEHVLLFDPFKDQIIDTFVFEEKMGFPVKKLPFYFALLGDASDNIPGVRGIGKKGALDLVQQFESLKDLYARLDEVKKDRTRKALEENRENAFLSERLFLLQYYPTGLTKKDFAFDKDDWINACPLFEKLDFKSLLKDLDKLFGQRYPVSNPAEKLAKYDFKTITNKEELAEFCSLLKKKKSFAFDTETDGIQPLQCKLVGISICAQEGEAYYIPCGHQVDDQQLSTQEIINMLKPILEDEQYIKYLHHAKFDQLVLYAHGVHIKGIKFDSLIAAKLLLKEWQSARLKQLSIYYFDEPMLTYDEVVKDNNYKNFSYVPLDLATRYAAGDAHQTFKLAQYLQKNLSDKKLVELYREIDHPLIQLLFDMEIEGISLDVQFLNQLNKKVVKELDTVKQQIYALIEKEWGRINFNSQKQVEQLLFYDLRLPPQKKSVKGKGYSTDHEVLSKLSKLHPVPGLIMKYRELFKLKSTYIEALPTYINPKTGKIHTTFSQISTATGRLSSYRPNLQNIPTDSGGYGIEIRAAFKPQEGHKFLSADYSQIELRVMAYLTQEQRLMEAFSKGRDIHTETAALLFDVPLGKVTHDQRQIGKRINFSILYGLTPYGLSKELDISFKDAKYYIDKYFEQYPVVSEWMEKVIEQVKDTGYVETEWGRRRYIPGIYERNKVLYEEARRIAINTRVQGTAADVMKLGMLQLDQALHKHGLDSKIVLQIHDELILSVPEIQLKETTNLVKSTLEGIVDWNVPLTVSLREGSNWKEITK